MQDCQAREINYLRISVTDRCNLRCTYCMPPEGVRPLGHDQVLRNEEIIALVRAAAAVGIKKIRLTGGEPLVRRGITELVQELAAIPEIDDLALTTNGVLLPAFAAQLKEAGLQRVNISLDTLQSFRYTLITRLGKLEQALAGIEAALEYGFHPVKINTVAIRGFNDDEINDLVAMTLDKPLHLRFIELMPVGVADGWAKSRHLAVAEIREIIERQFGPLSPVHKPTGHGPARYYTIAGARGTVGFISPLSDHFCHQCNRLRLTADGRLRPCLYDTREIDLKTPLRRGAGPEELAALFRRAVLLKPAGHSFAAGWQDDRRVMSQIGG
ncbi:MAG: GTP 3',8-cyclase MoaA [Bacillota bacterium]|uniref:GTP 3',8-cyclase MoaA n=1 Tax=Desulfurispora thermophila TaxID=265470 RepID=UPI00036E9B77|nr:GTP 3',8-cyclase MoaA [Desulfurispora thermophila]